MNQVIPVAKKDDHAPEEVGGVRPQTPIEVCAQIAAEHAASTIAAIAEQRAARLAGKLEDYGKELSELAGEDGLVEQPDVLGYRVERTESEEVPYELHGPRGAHYGLMRNVPNPSLLFAINMRGFGAVERLGWFTDRNGKLEHVR